MKKLLAVLSVLAFFFIAGPVSADWMDDLKPLPTAAEITYISVKFQGDTGIVIVETKSGSCTEYKIEGDRIAKMRKCGEDGWNDFIR